MRRDLRLADNPALSHACARHAQVIPVYILDDPGAAPWSPGAASRSWLYRSLQSLQADLRQRHSQLILRQGNSREQLQQLLHSSGATAVYWNRCYEPALRERDAAIEQWLQSTSITCKTFNASLWWEPWEISTTQQQPYRVFTPMWKHMLNHWRDPQLDGLPEPFPALLDAPASVPLDELKLLPQQRSEPRWDEAFYQSDGSDSSGAHWQPGETGAWHAFERFFEQALQQYQHDRDIPALTGTSKLSPHLQFGEISSAQIIRQLCPDGQPPTDKMINSFIRELAWREFSWHLLYHFPDLPEQPLQPQFANFPWRTEYQSDLARWQQGKTGIPIIDAGMRQLWQHGWMHNRVRMLVASLLTKNLLIPWQHGARWFWETLVDADLGNNSQGWQWTAGCGVDAAPFFRIFNPVTQGRRFDPKGDYVRRFVPELARLTDQQIHAPWAVDKTTLRQSGVVLGENYPQPLVDLQGSRQRALEAWQQMRSA